jgi:hypothetical protein
MKERKNKIRKYSQLENPKDEGVNFNSVEKFNFDLKRMN